MHRATKEEVLAAMQGASGLVTACVLPKEAMCRAHGWTCCSGGCAVVFFFVARKKGLTSVATGQSAGPALAFDCAISSPAKQPAARS